MAGLLALPALRGQSQPDLQSILERIEKLEAENRALHQEIRELRAEIAGTSKPAAPAAGQAPLDERVAIAEARIAEHEQVKVSTSQRFPLKITGMALFNLYSNGRFSDGVDNPVVAGEHPGGRSWGGSLRQSIIGLEYDGPQPAFGGKVHGSLMMDFFAGSSQVLDNLLRVRTGGIGIEWETRSLSFNLDKPLFAPRNPNSFSQVGVSPLTAAGNLWRWQPQVRFEQRFSLGRSSGLRSQFAFIQTSEDVSAAEGEEAAPPADYGYEAGPIARERRRPGVEGRFELWRRIDDTRRIELAPGFHFSRSLAAGQSWPSNLFSLDWFFNPWSRLEFSGAFFSGQNINHFGAPHRGYTIRNGRIIPVHSRGGWAQFTFLATDRLSFNLFSGQHDDRNRDLVEGDIGKNRSDGANLMYRLAPNVVFSFETRQARTTYLGYGRRLNTHYDLGIAYLF